MDFEEIFLEDLLDELYSLRHPQGAGRYDEIWNECLQKFLNCTCSFFGCKLPEKYSQLERVCHDAVNHPSHYCTGGIETLDYILAKRMDFLLGQVCKYISRAGLKDPAKELEDLEKARFYLDKKIGVLKSGTV